LIKTEIYALLDKESLLSFNVSLLDYLDHIKQYDIPLLQYRNKSGTPKVMQDDLALIREHFDGTLIVNNTVTLVSYADGLHIGQEDLKAYSSDPHVAVRKIRETIGNKMFGLSTHNKEEILESNDLDIDYIGLGAYRPTATKSDASVGGEKLIDLASLSSHPVAIIGGVRMNDRFPHKIKYKVIGSDLIRRLNRQE